MRHYTIACSALLLASLSGSIASAQTPPQPIVLEAESASRAEGSVQWKQKQPNSESTCRGSDTPYIRWESGKDAYGAPEDGIVVYEFEVPVAGSYVFQGWACQGTGGRDDEQNDAWVSVNGSDYAKFFAHTGGEWKFGLTEDKNHNKTPDKQFTLQKGTNRLAISGRSQNFALDKFVFFNEGQKEAAKNAAASPTAPGAAPSPATDFKGRIAYSADGNDHDPDDIGATPMSLALLAKAGLQDKLVHFDYNSHIWGNAGGGQKEKMTQSATEGAQRLGFNQQVFISAIDAPERAYQQIAQAVNASTPNDPLTFIVAGPMHVACEGLRRAMEDKRKLVRVISHSDWNNTHQHDGSCTADGIKALGVAFDQIKDQNAGTNTDYGQYAWMPAHENEHVRWVHERMKVGTPGYADPSDSGMVYYLLTDDQDATPKKFEEFFKGSGSITPGTPATRPAQAATLSASTPAAGRPLDGSAPCTAQAAILSEAIQRYAGKCGVAYDKGKGHDCDPSGNGWLCANYDMR